MGNRALVSGAKAKPGAAGVASIGPGCLGDGPTPFLSFPLSAARAVVDCIPMDRRVVLLGESTHGTEGWLFSSKS